jgi:hypothetical protein
MIGSRVSPLKVCAALLALIAVPALSRDSLGMFETWGAFRDAPNSPPNSTGEPRCYAIAKALPSQMKRNYQPYADVAIWPRRNLRGQIHFRLSRRLAARGRIVLGIGDQHFELTGGGGDAWAVDRRMDAGIVAAMRSAQSMTVSARGADGRGFSNTWPLAGSATAMDAAAIGCAGIR